jgi:hypothetical protein
VAGDPSCTIKTLVALSCCRHLKRLSFLRGGFTVWICTECGSHRQVRRGKWGRWERPQRVEAVVRELLTVKPAAPHVSIVDLAKMPGAMLRHEANAQVLEGLPPAGIVEDP